MKKTKLKGSKGESNECKLWGALSTISTLADEAAGQYCKLPVIEVLKTLKLVQMEVEVAVKLAKKIYQGKR
ncbi:MAG: hypothetical protein LBK60_01395 [Verrucomicrobiales bacterium]|jgi:hypothetical protein|nr:hypothetical protein [Verrucomicrobiales bacterium]